LDKVKRPAGIFAFNMEEACVDDLGTWLFYGIGATWRAPHDTGTMPFDALILIQPNRPFVTWWVEDPEDRRVEIDVCLPPVPTDAGWSFIDLELDPVRHERTGVVEVEDWEEFDEAAARGWMSQEDAVIARTTAQEMAAALTRSIQPWGDEGWARLERLRR
jgi:hypothetical protein